MSQTNIVTLLICAICSFLGLSESKSLGDADNTTMDLSKFNGLVQALKYGEACSWEAEEMRQKYTKLALSGRQEAWKEMVANIMEKEYKLCSALELFVCDKATQKCVCGDAGNESKLRVINRALYTLEGKKCRWNKDTYCTSEEFLQFDGVTVDAKCKTGTTCKTRDDEVCSKAEMLKYISKKYDQEDLNKAIQQILMSREVCSCKE